MSSWLWLALLVALHAAGLASMWWAGRQRGRVDCAAAAAAGWAAARALIDGIAAVWDSDDLETAKIGALKAVVRSLHRDMTAEQIASKCGAPVALVDKLLLDDRDLAAD